MSDADKETVMETRKKNKAKGSTPTKRKVSDVNAQLADLKRSIAALKMAKGKDDDIPTTDDSSVPDNAGDAFGGRSSKKSKKE
jgi:hypothetical protein